MRTKRPAPQAARHAGAEAPGDDAAGHARGRGVHVVVRIGKPAPHFRVDAYQRGEPKPRKLALEEFRGKWVVLFFYPRDFSSVCPTELQAFAERQGAFEKEETQIIAASTDSYHVHKAWFERDLPMVQYPILADTNHDVARVYGVLDDERGLALRGTFLIDPTGIVQHADVQAIWIGRSVDETLRLLQAFRSGKACPAEWKPGDPTL